MQTGDALLRVDTLSVAFGPLPVVQDLSFTLNRGQTLALVGESGSGKTLTGKALIGLLPRGARVTGGTALLHPRQGLPADLLAMDEPALRRIRGCTIGMIFQEPMSAFSPLHTIGAQVAEAVTLHTALRGDAVRDRCLTVFAQVGFPDPARAWRSYPFELSGGLRQRAMIAMAIACGPDLVIADEPTTALDVTTQAQVLDLLKTLQADTGMALILVTHDLGVVANMADQVVVMRRGRVMERGPCATILTTPGHPYTRALLAAAPAIPDKPHDAPPVPEPVLWADNLSRTYPGQRRGFGPPPPPVRAVQDVSLVLGRGETLAVVGESGSGKSTLARLLLRAEPTDPGATMGFRSRSGEMMDLTRLDAAGLKRFRRCVQMVFQDPFAALSPRMTVLDILTEPLRVHGIGTPAARRQRAAELMRDVGLPADHLGRYPHAFSGGQRQRIAIARALALQPEIVVCDEPTSALDVSVQAQVLDLLQMLKVEHGLSYLFISHDLNVVAGLADRVAVMRSGRVVEQGPAEAVLLNPRHPYTQALIAASPEPDMTHRLDLAAVARGAGAPESWPEPFGWRGDAPSALREVEPGHFVRCAA
jgi:peptide/nickel transport system ATP-binding protein